MCAPGHGCNVPHFCQGMRIAAPVPCNRRRVAVFSMSLRGAKRRGNPYSLRQCKTRSNTLGEYGKMHTNLPEVVPSCQVSLRGRGLPHQCAHWFAMTCRNLPGVCGCKNVVHNDMQKTGACQRVQGGGARGILYRPHPFSLCRFSKAARHHAALVSSISPMEAAQLEASECCPSFFPNL